VSALAPAADALAVIAGLPLADHSMGAAAIGYAAPPLLVFAALAALVLRERFRRKESDSD
jgi:hypothetical protein